MPDPNQTNPNQNPATTPIVGDSSVDQPIGFPQVEPPVTPVIPPPIAAPTTPTPASQEPTSPAPLLPKEDLPPLMPDFQNISDLPTQEVPANPTGPSIDTNEPEPAPPITPPIISSTPKKKFGGGKIIATILGLFLLIGGIAGGVLLTQQNQNLSEKASTDYHIACDQCLSHAQNGYQCTTECTDPNTIPGSCNTDAGCGAGQICTSGQCVTGSRTNGTCTGTPGQVCISSASYCQAGCTAGSGTCTDPANSFCAKITSTTGAPLCTAGQDCGPSSTIGAQACNLPGTQTNSYCCPVGKFIQNGACVNSGSGDNTSCGRNIDVNAPVCCSGACTGDIVCEPGVGSGRKECKTTVNGVSKWCLMEANSSWCGGTPPPGGGTPPPAGPSAQCQNVKAYSSTFTLLTSAQLSALAPNTAINFCVVGAATAGTFDKARFTINSVAQSETTTKRPSSQDFCQSYTVPTGVTQFNVSAQIHHATLGWK